MKYLKIFEDFSDLEIKLIGAGGEQVPYIHEEDLDRLIDDGEFFDPEDYNLVTVDMRSSQCHANSAAFYENFINTDNNSEEEIEIVTGWALSGDMWTQHSWIYFPFDGDIIETTSLKRDLYYGFILNDEETTEFLDNNY